MTQLRLRTCNLVGLHVILDLCFLCGFPGGSVVKESACNTGDPGSIPGLGRSSGGGHGNPLQYSCLENPMDRGTWWATVHDGHKESDMTGQLTLSYVTRGQGRSRLLTPCLPPGFWVSWPTPSSQAYTGVFFLSWYWREGLVGACRESAFLVPEINLSVILDRAGLEGFWRHPSGLDSTAPHSSGPLLPQPLLRVGSTQGHSYALLFAGASPSQAGASASLGSPKDSHANGVPGACLDRPQNS